MTARVEDLIFTALCDRLRSPTQIWQSMSVGELEEATGLTKEPLEEALRALRGADGRDDSRIAYGAGRVVLGPSGASSAEISQTILDATDRETSRCQREKLAEYLK